MIVNHIPHHLCQFYHLNFILLQSIPLFMKIVLLSLLILNVIFASSQEHMIKSIVVDYDYGKLNPNENQYGMLHSDTIEYDINGNKTREVLGMDGISYYVDYFNYEDGLLTSRTDNSNSKLLFYYTEDRLDSSKAFGSYNNLLNEEYFFYDTSSKLIKTTVWYPVLQREDSTIYSYGEDWIRKVNFSTPVSSEDKQIFYNEKGDEKESYIFYKNGKVWCEKYEYTYDSKGNWISKTTLERLKDENGVRGKWKKGPYVVKRKIVYY